MTDALLTALVVMAGIWTLALVISIAMNTVRLGAAICHYREHMRMYPRTPKHQAWLRAWKWANQ